MNDSSQYLSKQPHQQPSLSNASKVHLTLVASLAALVLLALLSLQMLYSTYFLASKQKGVNINVKNMELEIDSFEKKIGKSYQQSQKYTQAMKQDVQQNKNKIQLLYSTLSSSEDDDLSLVQSIDQVQSTQQVRKLQLDMVAANLIQLYRAPRIALFTKLINTSLFKQPKIQLSLNLSSLNFLSPYLSSVEAKHNTFYLSQQAHNFQILYSLNQQFQQHFFCVVVPTINNGKHFRFQYNMQSIVNQKYEKYKVVVVEMGSKDETGMRIRKFMEGKRWKEGKKFQIVQQRKGISKGQAVFRAVNKHCDIEDIVVLIDGSDQLIGVQTFSLLNSRYHLKPQLKLVYTDYIQGNLLTQTYTPQHSTNLDTLAISLIKTSTKTLPRLPLPSQIPPPSYSFLTFKAKYFFQIKQPNFEDITGMAADMTWLVPLLEMVCRESQRLQEYLAIKMYGNDQHGNQEDREKEWEQTKEYIRSIEHYQCQD